MTYNLQPIDIYGKEYQKNRSLYEDTFDLNIDFPFFLEELNTYMKSRTIRKWRLSRFFEGRFCFLIIFECYSFLLISDVFVKTAVCSPEAAILPEDDINLPSTDTICLPVLIIFAVPVTFPKNNRSVKFPKAPAIINARATLITKGSSLIEYKYQKRKAVKIIETKEKI